MESGDVCEQGVCAEDERVGYGILCQVHRSGASMPGSIVQRAHFVEALSPRDCGDALEECAPGGEQHAAGGYAEGGAEFQF